MSLNPNKTCGCDNISIQMLQLCAESIRIFPDQWKLANVTPIHIKNDKQLVSNYRRIALLPICSIIF